MEELQKFQHELCVAISKYLNIVSSCTNTSNGKIEKDALSLLWQIVAINEQQKIILNHLRKEQETASRSGDILLEQKTGSSSDNLVRGAAGCQGHDESSGENSFNRNNILLIHEDGRVTDKDISFEEQTDCGEARVDEDLCAVEELSYSPIEDIHNLVTLEEFMHALGLLTINECNEVLMHRKERSRGSAHSHIFSTVVWDRPESKRKRRDWLSSIVGSPPHLRKKLRANGLSRSSSPEGGGSHPSSQPLSPVSPPEGDRDAQLNPFAEETCSSCQSKGADVQCDGCGSYFHYSCSDCSENACFPGWLCSVCEGLGMRAEVYIDVIHNTRLKDPSGKITLETS